jgi:hypothetical protein
MSTLPEEEMVGSRLKHKRDYVFVRLFGDSVKHMFGGDHPANGSFTVCGKKIVGNYSWGERATSLGKLEYCRECERIWSES